MSTQLALVTGGTRGIGAACALRLAKAGHTVWITGRSEESVAQALAAAPGLPMKGAACDVSDFAAVGELIARIEAEEGGGLDLLVNNAGLTQDMLVMRMTEAQWDTVIDVNLKGCFNTVRHAVKGMMKKRGGAIINMTSVVALTGNPGQANYTAAKAGVIGLTRTLARELASRGIRVNAIAPGFIETDMTAAIADKAADEMRSSIPLGRIGTAEDIASTVEFLASPGAAYITGQVLSVDGGLGL